MKKHLLILAIFICLAATIAANGVPKIPKKMKGYTGFTINQVKKNKLLLNTFISSSSKVIMRAINERKIAAASYSVFLRYAFRQTTKTGFKILYYFRTHDPSNPKGKVYYGRFTVTTSATGGNRVLVEYSIDKALDRNP